MGLSIAYAYPDQRLEHQMERLSRLVGLAAEGAAGSVIIGQSNRTSRELDRIEERIRTRIEDPLDARHFNVVRREKAGQVVRAKASGQPFDHITEVQNAMLGLQNDVVKLKSILARGNLTDDQRRRAQALLRQASKRLDNAEMAVSKKPQSPKTEAEKKPEPEQRKERDD